MANFKSWGINVNAARAFQARPTAMQVTPSCPGGTLYTIRAGDTFFKLAQQFNVSVDAIIAANPNANPNSLQIGQQICIPPRPPIPCPVGFIYVIRPGDTLFGLANRFGTSVDSILAANPPITDPNRLSVGQNICIPVLGPTPSPAPTPTPTPIPCPPGSTRYTIRAGDTYSRLALQFNVSIDALIAANPGVNPNSLQIGQVICIPPRPDIPCPGGTIYVVKSGDTLFNLASRFGVTVDALIAANPQLQDPNRLTVGTNICIPPQS